jgi:MFS family permease
MVVKSAYIALFSILLVLITVTALIAGWYLRKFGKKKWLGYLISFIGFLPLLPIMIAGSLVYWMDKKYWMAGNKHLRDWKNYKHSMLLNRLIEGVN